MHFNLETAVAKYLGEAAAAGTGFQRCRSITKSGAKWTLSSITLLSLRPVFLGQCRIYWVGGRSRAVFRREVDDVTLAAYVITANTGLAERHGTRRHGKALESGAALE